MPDTEYITAYKVFIENVKGELLPITYLGRYLVKGGYSRNEWNEAPFGGVFALTTEESAIEWASSIRFMNHTENWTSVKRVFLEGIIETPEYVLTPDDIETTVFLKDDVKRFWGVHTGAAPEEDADGLIIAPAFEPSKTVVARRFKLAEEIPCP